jgi:hypothetical protein
MTPVTSANLLLEQIQTPHYWRSLNSSLSIEEVWTATAPDSIALEPEDLNPLLSSIREEGYFQLDSVLPEAEVFRMAIGIATLHEQQLPPVFAFVYDGFWRVFQRVSQVIAAILDEPYWQLPDFWAWYVEPSDAHAGWGPHRDKTWNTIRADGMPMTLTVWIPLTDALPINGCMSILPAHLDPNYHGDLRNLAIANFQDIRALPAPAGSVLGWNQAILHWGGRSSSKAAFPRISIACEFQRSDIQPVNLPLRPPHGLPTFTQRLALIGKQIQQYQHMYRLPAELAIVAQALTAQFAAD